jgi:NADH-quinone oxidoreductase subunit N
MIGAAIAGAAQLAAAGTNGCSIGPGGARITGVCTADNSLHIPVEYASILPILILSGGALVVLLVAAVLPKRSRPGLYPALTAVIGIVSLAAAVWQWFDVGTKHARLTIGQQVIYDRFSVFFLILISVATVFGALASDSYLRREGLDGVEAYALMLLAGTGAMLMAVSGGLIMLFLGLEIMSIALYVMAAFHRRRVQSGEAGFKYFILGSFSSAIFLYGIALVYGATGSTQFQEIASFLAGNVLPHNGVLLAGIALLIVGLGFKVAAVPFHFWTPDVYQGAPTPFTGYMAAVAKAAGFAGLLRVLNGAFSTEQANWRPAIWLITILTLAVGSVLALAQKDMKRMFAYSSISQAGYVLVGVQAASSQGTAGALYYLFTYTFIIIGTFAVVELIQGPGEARNDLGAIRGLSRRQPFLALAMLIFLLAQAGVPFTSGFLGKFYVISAAIQRGQYALGIIAMLAAAVAAFFYLRVALLMYSSEPEGAGEPAGVEGAAVGGIAPGAAEGAPVAVGVGSTPRTPGLAGETSAGSMAAGGVEARAGASAAAGVSPTAAASPVAGASGTGAMSRVDGGPGDGDGSVRDDTLTAGLAPVPGLDGPAGEPAGTAGPAAGGATGPAAAGTAPAVTLEPPPEGRIAMPVLVTVTLAVCAAFTIVAGISAFMITFARQATLLF